MGSRGAKRYLSPATPGRPLMRRRKLFATPGRIDLSGGIGGRRSRLFSRGRKRQFAQTGIVDEVFDPDDGLASDVIWSDYMKMPALGQGPGNRYGNKVKVGSINMDGCMVLGACSYMDDGNVVQRAGPVDGVLGLFVVLDREPSDQRKPDFADVFGPVQGTHGSKVDLHVRSDMLSRFRVLMREKVVVRNANVGSRMAIEGGGGGRGLGQIGRGRKGEGRERDEERRRRRREGGAREREREKKKEGER